MASFRPRDFSGCSPEQMRRLLNDMQREIAAALNALEQGDPVTPVITSDYAAQYGELVRMSPSAAGARLLLPPIILARVGQRSRIVLQVGDGAGPITIEAIDSIVANQQVRTLVNGQSVLNYAAGIGMLEFVPGPDGWFTENPGTLVPSVPGLPGVIGQNGAQGLQGDPGEPGRDGFPGPPGAQGIQGIQGAAGAAAGGGFIFFENPERAADLPFLPFPAAAGVGAATWAQTLVAGRNTGGTKPGIDAGDYIDVGTSGGTLPATGDIRARSTLTTRSTGAMAFTADAGAITVDSPNIAGNTFTMDVGSNINISCKSGTGTGTFIVGNAGTLLLRSGTTTLQSTAADLNLTCTAGVCVTNCVSMQLTSTNGGFLRVTEAVSSVPSLPAGEGMFWVKNNVQNLPMYTDDTNADHIIAFAESASNTGTLTVNALTTTITAAPLTIPANSVVAGTTFKLEVYGVFTRGATLTALNIVGTQRVNAVTGATAAVAGGTVAGVYGFKIEAIITINTIGAAGTYTQHLVCVIDGATGGSTVQAHSVGIATAAIDTTVARTLDLQVNMSAAVAATVLTVTNATTIRVTT